MTILEKAIRKSAPKNSIPGDFISNMPLVIFIAKKYQGMGHSLEDLIQEGSIGLATACEKYNSDKGAWGSYAYRWIQATIFQALNNTSRTVRVPAHIASNKEKLEANKVSVCELDPTYQGGSEDPVDLDNLTPEQELIQELLSKVDPKDAEVVKMKFGIGYMEELPTNEIAMIMGVSPQMVNGRFRRAMEAMKNS